MRTHLFASWACCSKSNHIYTLVHISLYYFLTSKENKETNKRASQTSSNPPMSTSSTDTCPPVPLASPLSVTSRSPKSSHVMPPSWAHKTDPAVVAESWGCFQISVHSEQTDVCQDAVLLVCVCVCVCVCESVSCHMFTVSSIMWMNGGKMFVVNLKHCGVASMFGARGVLCSPFCIMCVKVRV